MTLHSREGRQCALTLTAAPIRAHDGHINGVVTIFRDITSEQKLEEELQKASKLESVALMAGGIAHDFNNILTAILGHLSLAKATAAPSPAVISTIEKACLYATDLTRQLLTFAKGSTPNRRLESLADVVREARGVRVARLEHALLFRPARTSCRPVEVDRNQIHQVINNLVINAVQATAQGGMLHVEARQGGGQPRAARRHAAAGRVRAAVVARQRLGHRAGTSRADFRSVFHDQIQRQRAGAGDGVFHHQEARRPDPGRERTGRRHDVSSSTCPRAGEASRRCAAGGGRGRARTGGAGGGRAGVVHGRRGDLAGTGRGDARNIWVTRWYARRTARRRCERYEEARRRAGRSLW